MSLPNNFNHQIYLSDLLVFYVLSNFLPIKYINIFLGSVLEFLLTIKSTGKFYQSKFLTVKSTGKS